jgi:hypothetical protein
VSEPRALTKMLCPFPRHLIKDNPSGGGSYVAHPVVEQRLIDALGSPPQTEVMQIVRGWVPPKAPNPQGKSAKAKAGSPELTNAVVGVVLRMTVVIDGREVMVEEAGDCEDPHNWANDGARLKDAMSDAYKRCAMRLGVGLHLWAQDAFYLFRKFWAADGMDNEPAAPEAGGS